MTMNDEIPAPSPSTLTTRRDSLGVILLLAGAACLPWAPPALAHAALVRSDPARRAVLTQPPGQVRLWFNERIERDYSTISVLDSAGRTIATGQPKIPADDPKLLLLDLPSLAPGRYTVRYRINSVDGHVVAASYEFTVGAADGAK
jgi:methionine-rich copper-binding protein CopC